MSVDALMSVALSFNGTADRDGPIGFDPVGVVGLILNRRPVVSLRSTTG
jgi:hypothetical protein